MSTKTLTLLLQKSSTNEIRNEIAKLNEHDHELEVEREQIALTNHRHLILSIMKLDLVKTKSLMAKSVLHDIPEAKLGALRSSIEATNQSIKGLTTLNENAEATEKELHVLEKIIAMPARLQSNLENQDYSEFCVLFAELMELLTDTSPDLTYPALLMKVAEEALILKQRAVRALAERIGDPNTKISVVAESIGSLKRLLNSGEIRCRRVTLDKYHSELQRLEIDSAMSQSSLFGVCRRHHLSGLLPVLRLSAHDLSIVDLCDRVLEFLVKTQSQYFHSFKTQPCPDISRMFQEGVLFLWDALCQRLLGCEGDTGSTAVTRLPGGVWNPDLAHLVECDFSTQMSALLRMPEVLSPEIRARFNAVSMSDLALLCHKVTHYNTFLSRSGVDVTHFLLSPILIAAQYKVSGALQTALLEFEQDLATWLSPSGNIGFESLSPDNENTRELCACPPLALWLNSHYSVLNECRLVKHLIGPFLIGAFFNSMQALLLTFRNAKRALSSTSVDESKQDIVKKLRLMSATINGDLFGALRDAETNFLSLDPVKDSVLVRQLAYRDSLLGALN
eukprot:Blabericola_migrator_1__12115@NODE_747_length_6663_cov_33_227259_g331_i2_p1_GENE_NODE_747_length_6663_cov_33_227259_g331_i2NODE_747_length_6663_cov_33_227259_g331_i2_p1_ORF_typecomplete_len563_score139_03Dor1/PF04124_12/8_7e05Sec5/PF15469_6/0_0035HD_2/PF12917_7/0_12DUF5449/PF17528_2/11DUF5449/PF17528_2/75_NODE_747_length_6663_cov_33_227259_g331_i213062994